MCAARRAWADHNASRSMCPPGMIRAPAALLRQHPVWVDVTLEPVEEGSARVLGHPPAIIARMHGMGRHARTQTPFLR